jgi:hypothetical protein
MGEGRLYGSENLGTFVGARYSASNLDAEKGRLVWVRCRFILALLIDIRIGFLNSPDLLVRPTLVHLVVLALAFLLRRLWDNLNGVTLAFIVQA